MDVVVWLRSLGLGKYEAAFRENDIDENRGTEPVHDPSDVIQCSYPKTPGKGATP